MNKVNLIGRITKDPELKTTENKKKFVWITLATNDNNGTTFVPCIAWERNAENICEFLKKGSLIGVDGYLFNNFSIKNEIKQNTLNVLVSKIYFLDHKSKKDNYDQLVTESGFEYNPNDVYTSNITDDELIEMATFKKNHCSKKHNCNAFVSPFDLNDDDFYDYFYCPEKQSLWRGIKELEQRIEKIENERKQQQEQVLQEIKNFIGDDVVVVD